MITELFANVSVTALDRSEDWYATVFGRGPDRRPMDGLIEWQLGNDYGLQVFEDADRAGHSTFIVGESDLDARVARLRTDGIQTPDPQPGGGARIVQLVDPDGNRLVLTGE